MLPMLESLLAPPKADTRELAFRIPAEPGWRVVAFQLFKEGEEEGTFWVQFSVLPVVSWGYRSYGHQQVLQPMYGVKGQVLKLYGDSFMGGSSLGLEPLDEEGKVIPAFSILPPSNTKTEDELLKEAIEWGNQSTEKKSTESSSQST